MALDIGVFLDTIKNLFKSKVSSNDTQPDYLINKFTSSDASVTITETNDGGVEQIDLTASAGGGGGNTIYSADDTVANLSRTINLAGSTSIAELNIDSLASTNLFKLKGDGQGIRNSSNSLITQFNSTALNPYIEVNSSGTNNSSLVFSQAGTQKYLVGFENSGDFRIRDIVSASNRFVITSSGSFELSSPSVTTSKFNLGGDMYIDASTQLSATFKGTSNTYINIDNGSTANASSVGYSSNGVLKWLTGYEGTTGSYRIRSQVTTNTPFKIDTSDNIIMANLPTSSAGLPTGALWNNSGVINIA